MTTKCYIGTGPRRPPSDVKALIVEVSHLLGRIDYTLRSGASEGAEMAFEVGAVTKQIFLPWAKFNGHPSQLFKPAPDAFEIAKAVHPAWKKLSPSARKLQARNVHLMLGQDCQSPVDFVLCWTPDGCEHESERTRLTGRTARIIALASQYGIPVFNLATESVFQRLAQFLNMQAANPSVRACSL